MVVVASPFVSNSFVYDTVPYDPIKDFDPVTLSLTNPVMLSVNPSLPAQTVKDLVALIRANPDKYSYASAATGTRTYFMGESFKQSLNLDLVHVLFNGGGLAVVSVLAGHTPVFFSTPPPVVQHIKEGTLRALAVMSKARSQILPDVPTIAEAGYPDFEGEEWLGILVPAGTPKEIIALSWPSENSDARRTRRICQSDCARVTGKSCCTGEFRCLVREVFFLHFLSV